MDRTLDLGQQRDRVYRWLWRCLIGPGEAVDSESTGFDLHGISPLERYQSAILFPLVKGEEGIDPAGETDSRVEFIDDDEAVVSDGLPLEGEQAGQPGQPDPLARPKRRYTPPSSAGFSFFIAGDDIRLQLIPRAVHYRADSKRGMGGRYAEQVWQRIPLGTDGVEARNLQPPGPTDANPWRETVFDGRAELFALWRALADGWLVTLSLSNITELPDIPDIVQWKRARNHAALFEASLQCVVDAGEVGPYPGVQYSLLSEEEQELELQYREHRIYAIGHGVAVDWQIRYGRVHRLNSDFLPRTEVPGVSAEVAVGDNRENILKLDRLAGMVDGGAGLESASVIDELDGFVSGYRQWVQGQQTAFSDEGRYNAQERVTARRIADRMDAAIQRMNEGVALLRRDSLAARAFAIANRAMRMQMAQADRCNGVSRHAYNWRPFQLAFLLLTLEPTVNEDSEFRDTLDLIWFPTGGGKTEAYLGLMAFLIVWRRLKFPTHGGGTAILMRYTLRLLTKDQFRRAARLICALDLLRRECSDLGAESISVGLWVGKDSSPNLYQQAADIVTKAAQPPAGLVLEACPWCSQPFEVPRSYRASAQSFSFMCHNPECDFRGARLPCNVVDEALYAAPPTLLIATIDKFARLAWEARTSAFFGKAGFGGKLERRPPELIVQDELHLIASALGSIAGLYEAGLDTVLECRGVRPKLIASTATIRMADEQARRLYGREAAVFPPPGLSADDSYFARTVPVEQKPGRLYVGYMAPALGTQRCMAPLAAALLSAPEILFDAADQGPGGDRDSLLDAWWTVLVYHGSLKGVGSSRNALQDIDGHWRRLQDEVREQARRGGDPVANPKQWPRREQLELRVERLTGNISADSNAANFDRLRLPRGNADALDMVLATNMISVGLDVSRLATMIINGQPLTTAEYIQASSRVGRGEVPGIVVANYYRGQARSLSHYESFRAYHQSFYRFVEPTSVTPYTQQARERVLHAALVTAMRHGHPCLNADDSAARFDPSRADIAKIIELLKRRCRQADPQRADATDAHIDQLAQEWLEAAQAAAQRQEALVYQAPDNDRKHQRLLYSHDARIHGLWATLNSMRNVENTALLMPR